MDSFQDIIAYFFIREVLFRAFSPTEWRIFRKSCEHGQCPRTNRLSSASGVFLQHLPVVPREVWAGQYTVNAGDGGIFGLSRLCFPRAFLADVGCVSFAREFLVWQDLFAHSAEMSAISFLLCHSLHPSATQTSKPQKNHVKELLL